MPATSKAQRRLFALALAVKRGEVPASDVDDKIKDLAKRSEKDLKDFAETPEETLPNKVEDNIEENNAAATPGSVNGMGAVSMPGNPGTQTSFSTQETGSGDLAASSALTTGNPDKDGKKAKKIYKFLKFNAFVGESLNEEKAISADGLPRGFFEVTKDFKLSPGGGWSISFKKGEYLRSNSWGLQRLIGPNKFEEIAPPIKGTKILDITQYGRRYTQEEMIDEFSKNTKEILKSGKIISSGGK